MPRIEEILANIKVKIKKSLGEDFDIRDPTIETRKLFNIKRLRGTFFQHSSIVECCSLQGSVQGTRTNFVSNINMEYVKQIQKLYRNFKFGKSRGIDKTKCISDLLKEGSYVKDDLKTYALNLRPSLNLFNLNHLEALEEAKRREKEQGEIKKPDRVPEAELIDSDYNFKMNENETWLFDVWYNANYKVIILYALRHYNDPKKN